MGTNTLESKYLSQWHHLKVHNLLKNHVHIQLNRSVVGTIFQILTLLFRLFEGGGARCLGVRVPELGEGPRGPSNVPVRLESSCFHALLRIGKTAAKK